MKTKYADVTAHHLLCVGLIPFEKLAAIMHCAKFCLSGFAILPRMSKIMNK